MRGARSVLSMAIAILVAGCAPPTDVAESNKQVVMAAGEALNNKRYDDLGKYIAESYHRHCQATPDINIETLADYTAMMKEYDGAFADGRLEFFQLIAEGDFVAFTGSYLGTHTGQMGPFPATGKTVDSEFAGYHRFENGKIVETWITWDNMAMMQQLGLLPSLQGGAGDDGSYQK